MEAELIADHSDALVGACEFDELGGAVEGVREWLLEEDVAAGEEAGVRNWDMHVVGVADEGDVRFLRKGFVERGEDGDAVDVFDVAFGVGAHGGRDDVGETARSVSAELDGVAEDGTEVAGVALADAAEADDEDFHGSSL